MVACNYEIIDENSKFIDVVLSLNDSEDLKDSFFVSNSIAHGSVMFRESIANKLNFYSNKFGPTEDYELWTRISPQGKFYVITELLYKWRISRNGISVQKKYEQKKWAKKISDSYWKKRTPVDYKTIEIIKKANHYYKSSSEYGDRYKKLFLSNQYYIAIKFIKSKRILLGCKRFVAIALSGKVGLIILLKNLLGLLKEVNRY